jgi:hypothetical protein
MKLKLMALLTLVRLASFSQSPLPEVEFRNVPPDLNLILQSMEQAKRQNRDSARPYEVTRQYKVFRGDDKQPTSEVTAQIRFTPPSKKTFKIISASGNRRGEKIVRDLLEHEAGSVSEGRSREIDRTNYQFAFLRQEKFGDIPEFVLHIVPKRKERGLMLGQIWVDARTFRIRRIEGVPVKSPSIWIKDSYITLQFAAVNGAWISVSFDAIAAVRFLGRYTLTGICIEERSPASATTP